MEEQRTEPDLASVVRVPGSHTSTQQWQSFELRMRRRRAERLVDRAAAAIQEGRLPAAREALDEARTLDPYNPALEAAATRLQLAERQAAARRPSVALQAVAAAVTAAVCGGGVFLLVSPPSTERAAESGRASAAPAAVQAAASPAVPPSVQVEQSAILVQPPEPDAPTAAPASTPPQPREPASAPLREPQRVREIPAALASGAPVRADAPAPPSDPPQLAAALRSPAPEAPLASPTPLPSGPGVTAGIGQVPLPAATAQPAAGFTVGTAGGAPPVVAGRDEGAPPPGAAADERLVRAILGRYEAAYSALDAEAAGAVWPSVDRRALERAFGSLSSQDLSLGACDIRVSGSSARAECSGRIRWTPRVGSGTQAASRRWRFDLRNEAGDWRIVQANVQ